MPESRLYCPEEEFTWRLRSRLPMNVGFTFTQEQLQALRGAFGNRFESRHSLDMRGRVYLPWSRYYVVIQFGRDRRVDARRSYSAARARVLSDTLLVGAALSGAAACVAWLLSRWL